MKEQKEIEHINKIKNDLKCVEDNIMDNILFDTKSDRMNLTFQALEHIQEAISALELIK